MNKKNVSKSVLVLAAALFLYFGNVSKSWAPPPPPPSAGGGTGQPSAVPIGGDDLVIAAIAGYGFYKLKYKNKKQ